MFFCFCPTGMAWNVSSWVRNGGTVRFNSRWGCEPSRASLWALWHFSRWQTRVNVMFTELNSKKVLVSLSWMFLHSLRTLSVCDLIVETLPANASCSGPPWFKKQTKNNNNNTNKQKTTTAKNKQTQKQTTWSTTTLGHILGERGRGILKPSNMILLTCYPSVICQGCGSNTTEMRRIFLIKNVSAAFRTGEGSLRACTVRDSQDCLFAAAPSREERMGS